MSNKVNCMSNARVRFAVVLAVVTYAAGMQKILSPADEPPIPFELVPSDKWTGEPYELAGKRLAFTSWYYVRQGRFNWVNDQGQGVAARPQAKIGPWGAP